MDVIRLSERPSDWDSVIDRFDTKTLFHEGPWLDHVQTIHPRGRIEYFRIKDDGKTVGYFCALKIRKMLLSIYGSPLGGTGTNYMGPIVNKDTNQSKLIRALIELCMKRGIAHFELSHDWLDPAVMESHGFTVHKSVTHVCPLPTDEETAWSQLRSTCRNRIRNAEKNGLVVEMTDDPSIVDHYYAQLREVYANQGLIVPFGKDRPRSLFDHLLPADRIFPVWVKHQGTVIAAGLFPHDARCVYFWGAASWVRYQHLCPNELLHWTIMKLAIARGIPLYNMCGGTSRFKDKFGGSDVPYNHYSKSALPLLRRARQVYRSAHFLKLKMLGSFRA